ncbi:chaperonin 10-like protein [Podospora didyma]|uniref:Chaperonin 10-like protein n=1 Tax=Podospora didyma TaxID=330526 RepID=A0AAE0N6P2_9PEZI|nr:chaperonin 10-like protein [Podospora didyma]
MSATPTHKALYLTSTGTITILSLGPDPPYTPTGSESLVQVQYSGINPGDLRHFHMGLHSFIMGYDFSGTVLSSGPSSPFSPGDPVLGMTNPAHQRPHSQGAHQAFLIADPYLAWRRPSTLSPQSAVGIPCAAQTAADALFNRLGFGLPQAGVPGDDAAHHALLIWGAGSSVGWAALQLARCAGFAAIFVTASPHNHAALLDAGATKCFDYRSPDVVQDIRSVVTNSGLKMTRIFDAVGAGLDIFQRPDAPLKECSLSSPFLAKQCLSDDIEEGEVRLTCTLPVLEDEDWKFCLWSRKADDQQKEYPGWWERQEKVVTWLIENHEVSWRPLPRLRVVNTAEGAVQAVRDVFGGKVSMEKVVVQHPLRE